MNRNSTPTVCTIIPSRMLRMLGELPELQEQRASLQSDALVSERIRGHRDVFGLLAAATPAGTKRRSVYDARNKASLPGALVRGETDAAAGDASVNQAFDSAGYTYDFYAQELNRNSVDNHGLRLDSSVHFRQKFNNAFWNGKQMVYGDGDGALFLGFTSALDVVAHELTHGVTQFSVPGGLVYQDQSGALNESISDVFGSLVKQWHSKQDAASADWLIGAGILNPKYGVALRSMKAPGTAWIHDDQPKDMSGYVNGGDVHTNSGIPNHAFYLAAAKIGGKAWVAAGKAWYQALPTLHPDATFADAGRATVAAATALFGAGSPEASAIQSAWQQVGVLP